MTQGLVSILIPVFNAQEYLSKCLDSILGQTYSNWELILIDDFSTDVTIEICQQYAKKMPDKIKYLKNDKKGVSYARDKGIRNAQGDFICFVDSDDWVEPDMLKELIAKMTENDCQMAIFGYYLHEPGRTRLMHSQKGEKISGQEGIRRILTDNTVNNFLWNKIYIRALFDDIFFTDHMVYEDMSVLYKLADRCEQIYVASECYYHYNKRYNSLSETITMQNVALIYQTAVNRSADLLISHPELEQELTANRIDSAIIAWIRVCRVKDTRIQKQYAYIREDITSHSEVLKRIGLKHRLSGRMLCISPALFAFLMRLMKGTVDAE